MRVLEQVVPAITASASAIAVAQAPTINVPMTLVSSPFNITTIPDRASDGTSGNLSRRIQLTGVTDVSAVTFAITGLDRNGNKITENLVGPAAGLTVLSAKVYAQVISIVPNATSANTLSVGWGTESVSQWVVVGNYKENFNWKLRVFFPAGGTANFDVEGTSEDMMAKAVTGDLPDDLITLTGAPQTGNYTSDNTTPWAFIRLKVHSAGQSVTMRLLPSRTV